LLLSAAAFSLGGAAVYLAVLPALLQASLVDGLLFAAAGIAQVGLAVGLLVCADGGGSNGYRVRAWKTELARLAGDTGLQVTVCHLPPGTSKWNRIEDRLFRAISMTWRGRPLASHEVVVELIGATTTQTGLRVRVELDRGRSPLGVGVRDEELAAMPLARRAFHGE
jgi:hypothetical protein